MQLLTFTPTPPLPRDRRPLPDVCARCGECCFEKEYGADGTVTYGSAGCEYLDRETRLCAVYADRHARKQGCRPITLEVIAEGWLPAECVYYIYFSPSPPDLRSCFA